MIRRGMTARDWGTFLVSPKGRARRYDFNIFYLLTLVAYVFAAAADYANLGLAMLQPGAPIYFSQVTQLIFLWPCIAVNTRRLHDLGYSGWWQIVGFIVPMLIATVGVVYSMMTNNLLGAKISSAAMIGWIAIFFIILSCVKGQAGNNRFGADPLAN